MTYLRKYNAKGIEKFRVLLSESRQTGNPPSREPLEDDSLTEPVLNIELEKERLQDRASAAEYLYGILEPVSRDEKMISSGLWTWLSHYYFESICPVVPQKSKRTIGADSRYLFDPDSSWNRRNHLLQTVWRAIDMAPYYNRIMLCGPVHIMTKTMDIITNTLYINRIPCVFEVIDRLYWDVRRGCPKSGMIDADRKGSLKYRLLPRIRQLERNFDLPRLEADELLELLGKEFSFARESDSDRPLLNASPPPARRVHPAASLWDR